MTANEYQREAMRTLNPALDREALIRELGDVAWYLAETAAALDLDLDTVLRINLAKLCARYPEGFSAEQSMHRDEAPALDK